MKTYNEGAYYQPSHAELQAEIEESQRTALFARISDMLRAGWRIAEVNATIAEWPIDWQRLVK